MRLGHTVLCLFFTALICPALLATDRWYGTVQGWGLLLDPDGDCSFTVAADKIEIGVPATPHGLSSELNRMNAPRVLQQATGNFDLQVEVDGRFQPQQPTVATRTAYLGAGLALIRNDQNYIRLERAALRRGGQVRHYVNFEQRRDGTLLRFGTPADFSLQADDKIQLKLSVRGRSVEGFARKNNQDWQTLGKKLFADAGGLSVGIAAINATNVPQKATFRSLRLTRQTDVIAESERDRPGISPESAVMTRTMRTFELQRKATALPGMADAERKSLVDEVVQFLNAPGEKASPSTLDGRLAFHVGGVLEKAGLGQLAAVTYRQMADAVENRFGESGVRLTQSLRQAARRANLLGNTMRLSGPTLSGETLDWSSYRGKVVLVDFWASWCGPCRREIPNVREQYRNYRDRGFDVVGICLDTDREKAESYIAEQDLPWLSLFQENAGGKHPIAERYGISSIPTAILVDRAGQVVSLNARGDQLKQLLAEMIGPAGCADNRDEPESDPPQDLPHEKRKKNSGDDRLRPPAELR